MQDAGLAAVKAALDKTPIQGLKIDLVLLQVICDIQFSSSPQHRFVTIKLHNIVISLCLINNASDSNGFSLGRQGACAHFCSWGQSVSASCLVSIFALLSSVRFPADYSRIQTDFALFDTVIGWLKRAVIGSAVTCWPSMKPLKPFPCEISPPPPRSKLFIRIPRLAQRHVRSRCSLQICSVCINIASLQACQIYMSMAVVFDLFFVSCAIIAAFVVQPF